MALMERTHTHIDTKTKKNWFHSLVCIFIYGIWDSIPTWWARPGLLRSFFQFTCVFAEANSGAHDIKTQPNAISSSHSEPLLGNPPPPLFTILDSFAVHTHTLRHTALHCIMHTYGYPVLRQNQTTIFIVSRRIRIIESGKRRNQIWTRLHHEHDYIAASSHQQQPAQCVFGVILSRDARCPETN